MCKYFSCIITRDLKVYWSKKSCSHEDILSELKLSDTKLVDRDFVRIEITPKKLENITRNAGDWNYRVDEEDTVLLEHYYHVHPELPTPVHYRQLGQCGRVAHSDIFPSRGGLRGRLKTGTSRE